MTTEPSEFIPAEGSEPQLPQEEEQPLLPQDGAQPELPQDPAQPQPPGVFAQNAGAEAVVRRHLRARYGDMHWRDRYRRLQVLRTHIIHGRTWLLSLVNQFGSWFCSAFCFSWYVETGPMGHCGERCSHPECDGLFGGNVRFHPWPPEEDRRGDRYTCILNDQHEGDHLCMVHAPAIRFELQVYRPGAGPAEV